MALEIQSAQVQPGTPCSFTFSSNVCQYLCGIAGFWLDYGTGDYYQLSEVSVSLDNQGHNGEYVTLTPNGKLWDSNGKGKNLNPGSSWINVVVVAWTGTNNTQLQIINCTDAIANNGTSGSISLPSSNMAILHAVVSGFDLAYDGAYDVRAWNVGVGVVQNGDTCTITGNVGMNDNSTSTGFNGNVHGGIIGSSNSSPGFEVQTVGNLTNNNSPQTLTFKQNLSSCVAFLTSFGAEFSGSDAHQIYWLAASVGATVQNGNQVAVSGYGRMQGSNNDWDDGNPSNSYASGLVIGIYA